MQDFFKDTSGFHALYLAAGSGISQVRLAVWVESSYSWKESMDKPGNLDVFPASPSLICAFVQLFIAKDISFWFSGYLLMMMWQVVSYLLSSDAELHLRLREVQLMHFDHQNAAAWKIGAKNCSMNLLNYCFQG